MTNLIKVLLGICADATREELAACAKVGTAYAELSNEEDVFVATRGAMEDADIVTSNGCKKISMPLFSYSKAQKMAESGRSLEMPWVARVEARNQQQSPAPFRDVDSPPPILGGDAGAGSGAGLSQRERQIREGQVPPATPGEGGGSACCC